MVWSDTYEGRGEFPETEMELTRFVKATALSLFIVCLISTVQLADRKALNQCDPSYADCGSEYISIEIRSILLASGIIKMASKAFRIPQP